METLGNELKNYKSCLILIFKYYEKIYWNYIFSFRYIFYTKCFRNLIRFLSGEISKTIAGKLEDFFAIIIAALLAFFFFKWGNKLFKKKLVDEIDQIGKRQSE